MMGNWRIPTIICLAGDPAAIAATIVPNPGIIILRIKERQAIPVLGLGIEVEMSSNMLIY